MAKHVGDMLARDFIATMVFQGFVIRGVDPGPADAKVACEKADLLIEEALAKLKK